MTSSVAYPRSLSAALLYMMTSPLPSVTMMPSGDASMSLLRNLFVSRRSLSTFFLRVTSIIIPRYPRTPSDASETVSHVRSTLIISPFFFRNVTS